MSVRVIYGPEQIRRLSQENLRDTVCVVIDVLRATSTLVAGCAAGAVGFLPVLEPEEALELRREHPHALVAGERGGKKVCGFDFGNSPRELVPEVVKGKEIIFTTTNGTRTLLACASARLVVAGAFLNLSAVIRILQAEGGPVALVCAGTGDDFSYEDAFLAGAIAQELDPEHPVASLYRSGRNDIESILSSTRNGRRLKEIGLQEDVTYCSQVDLFQVVPRLETSGWVCA